MQMSVFVSKDKKKLRRENRGCDDDDKTKECDAAHDGGVKPAQSMSILTTRESRHKNVGEKIGHDGEDHSEPAECTNFRDGVCPERKEANQKNGDLSLDAIKDSVRGEMLGQANDFMSIFQVFSRAEIDHVTDVVAQHDILQKQYCGRNCYRHTGIDENVNESKQTQKTHGRAGEIDGLDAANIGAQTRNNAQDTKGKLNRDSGENDQGQKRGIHWQCAILDEKKVHDGSDHDDGDGAQFPPHPERGFNQLTESMSILPDASAD